MRKLFVCIALGLTTLTGNAASPLWMRDVQISPDGTEIAFCYKGDIYKVSAGGGTAIQLTTQPSYECTPIWSPDSKQIAFASDRNGNFDIFVMPATGGSTKTDYPFFIRTAFGFYTGWKIYSLFSIHPGSVTKCFVPDNSHDRTIQGSRERRTYGAGTGYSGRSRLLCAIRRVLSLSGS